MAPTFSLGDYLTLETNCFNKLKPGDIIVFQIVNKTNLVHRIVFYITEGFVTQGDNNFFRDEIAVTKEDVIGKVIHYERNGKIHKVWNGRLGMLRGWFLHRRLYAIRAAKFFLRKPYRLLKKKGIVAKLWRPEIEILHFVTQDGPLVKYIHKGKTVASCWTDSNHWWFRRPYDFVVGPKLKN